MAAHVSTSSEINIKLHTFTAVHAFTESMTALMAKHRVQIVGACDRDRERERERER